MNDNRADWFSYDSAAEVYHSISVPLMFQRPAEVLIALLKPESTDRLLDVGSGTGAIARAAQQAKVGFIAAVDLSVEMLKRTSVTNVVVGRTPGLPFSEQTFQLATAGFVLTHVPDYNNALRDMVRVLTPSGKAGLSFWRVNQNEYTETWSQIAQSFAGKDFFKDAAPAALPWEDWFTEPDHINQALKDAGLSSITIEERLFPCRTTIDDYLASRYISLQARFLRQRLDEFEWRRFLIAVLETFHNRFADPLEFSTVVLFGLAKKARKS
jgi:ubiquinone/menaquinone biosynthesis C-methylase UbiE